MKIKLDKYPTPLSIVGLYNEVAVKAGFNPDNCTYDCCTKIEVSSDIMDAIEDNGAHGTGETFAMTWLLYGPKENKELEELTVDIQKGFAKEAK